MGQELLLLKALLAYVVLLGSVVFHEYFHACMAQRLGDNSPALRARLTLDPRPHIDKIGTVILPLIVLIIGSPILIGWAKPVPVNVYNLRNPKKDMMLIGASGPLTNFALAFIFTLLFKTGIFPAGSLAEAFIAFTIFLNLILATFNLIPLPPLDGSHILFGLLPSDWERKYIKIQPFAIYILIFLVFTGILRLIIFPVFYIWTDLFNINFITPALTLLGR